MSKELIVSATRHETRVAILEDDQLVEIFHQREKEYSLAGSIHKGRVTRVLPGMQSAFVDIGLERDAFLYVSDFFEDNEEYDKIVSGVEEKVLKLEKSVPASASADSPDMMEPEIVALLGAVPGAIVTAPAASAPGSRGGGNSGREGRSGNRDGGNREAGNRESPSRDGAGDSRGGRGRRGRRRRPGAGGLPESKFFSPREGGGREPRESRAAAPVAAAPESETSDQPVERTEAGAGMVLPGESISKYVGRPAPEQEFEVGEPDELAAQIVHEEHAEATADAEQEAEAAADVEEPLQEASIQASPAIAHLQQTYFEEEVTVEEVVIVPEPESVEAIADSESAIAEALAEALETSAAETDDDGANGEIAEPEGPEPARIPQSLTATLREQGGQQGGRLPHRVSRRMRRRMRGDRPEEQAAVPAEAQAEPVAAAATEEVKAPERERRPQGGRQREERERAPQQEARPALPSITDLLRSGQEIIVQIAKEPLGQKGARITSHIALPGRFLVYMPTVDHIGVSRKIPSDEERQRLKRVLQTNRTGIPGGFIVRTAGENRTEEELRADMMFLSNMWTDMRQKADKKPAPLLLHHDLDVVERILRDQLTSAFKTVWVDNELVYENVLSFVQRFQPAMVSRIKLYTRPTPIFDEFGITQELEKALRPKVWLKSGGYIVINQTEALVAIDINTGKYVGKSNRLEDTIVKINTDAIKEIVRQIRLRDLGGIIVVDFIDMDERKNRQKVMQVLEECMRVDRAPYKILQFNDFGLVAITRKRVKQSLERTLCSPCPYCEAAGYVKSVTTVISEILQEAHKISKAVEGENNVMLRVSPDVAKVLKSNDNDHLEEIETILGRSVLIKSDPLLHQTKFDLA